MNFAPLEKLPKNQAEISLDVLGKFWTLIYMYIFFYRYGIFFRKVRWIEK